MIVLFDTSCLVSAALKSESIPERAFLTALSPRFVLVVSQAVLDEYREVLFRPKFDRYASAGRRAWVLDQVGLFAQVVDPTMVVRECRDPKDNKFLELAASANADIIVSSDARHLLAMDPWRGTRILSPAAFLAYTPDRARL